MSDNLEFDSETNTLTVTPVEGVVYTINSRAVEGEVQLKKTTVVKAVPVRGFKFPKGAKTEFKFEVDSENKTPEPKATKAADPVVEQTAGSTPESANVQANKAAADARVSGANPRLP